MRCEHVEEFTVNRRISSKTGEHGGGVRSRDDKGKWWE